jgi:hypothetical protein
MKSLKISTLILCFLAALLSATPTVRGQQFRIAGLVLDNDNRPIKGVTVRIYRGSRVIREAITRADGAYALSFDRGGTITTIEYYGSEWNPTTISNISGAKSHTINKVLSKLGEVVSEEQALELLSTFDHLYLISRQNNIAFSEFTRRYGAALDAARKTAVPPDLRPELSRRQYLYEPSNYNEMFAWNFNPNASHPPREFAEALPSSTSSIDFAQRSSGLELDFHRGISEIVVDVDRPFDEGVYSVAVFAQGVETPLISQSVQQPEAGKVLRLHFHREFFKSSSRRYEVRFTSPSSAVTIPLFVNVEE